MDKAGFEQCLEEEKAKNSVGGGDGGKDMVLMAKETSHLATENVQPTEQSAKYESGGGNGSFALPATVKAIFTGRGDSPGEQVNKCLWLISGVGVLAVRVKVGVG